MGRRLAIVSLGVAACAAQGPRSRDPAPALSGFWSSDGYGITFEIVADSAMKINQVTAVSCIPAGEARATPAPPSARAAFRLVDAPATFLILPDSGPDRIRVHFNGAASDIVVNRLPGRPSICERPTPDTPRSNFEVFVTTWAEHYPFFQLKATNWPAVVERARATTTDRTTPAELFQTLKTMIEPLHDAHTGLRAESIGQRFNGFRLGPNRLERDQYPRAYALTERYLDGPIRKFCQGQLEFGTIGGDVGYLRLRSFSGYHGDRSFESGLVALEAALDTVLANAGKWRGLLIDVRINGGGADPYGLAIASRLTATEYLAYAKQARNDPRDPTKWTAEQVSRVRPTERPGFRGPVVELTGLHSVGAAETFTQALLNRVPKVTRVGENTQGVFSDVLGRKLPNGWQFGLPNERFVTNGVNYDGPGIPPDLAVPVFPAADLAAGKDWSFERGLAAIPPRP